MGGGGKGGGNTAPVQKTYTDPVNGMSFTDDDLNWNGINTQGTPYRTGAQKLNEEITSRKAGELNDTNTAKAAADKKTADDEAAFQTRAGTAKQSATDSINDYFSKRGLDPTKYTDDINRTVSNASQHVADLDPDPAGKYAATMGSDLYNSIQSGKQTQNLSAYNAKFAPDYSQKLIGDDLVGSSVSSIVNSQLDPLNSQLENAHKRGTLNDVGYQAALKALGDSRTSATSTVTGLANNVLSKDRGDLDAYIGGGRSFAGTVPLGSDFDPATYEAGAQTRAKQFKDSFGGDLTNAVGTSKFSDLTSLLNAGGAVQGATDPTATNPMGALGPDGKPIGGDLSPAYIASQALANEKRGLGSTGAY